MRCPKCNSENKDSAKFCKKCGSPLKKINPENGVNSGNNKSEKSDSTKFLIIALIIVAIILAGVFVYIYGFNSNQGTDVSQQIQGEDDDDSDSMTILGGSFTTGGELEDKTYASIKVGSEFAGEKVTVQIFYSRDGSTLNNGNMVPVTVDSSGTIEVSSADAYRYFPDYAEINLFDASGDKLLDTKSVSLSPEAGTQTF